jgi:hypothetical protein
MSVLVWVILFAVTSLFWAWIVFGGGAERLEGTIAAVLLIDWFAARWSADGIRAFAVFTWLLQTIWFAIGLFVPTARFWW